MSAVPFTEPQSEPYTSGLVCYYSHQEGSGSYFVLWALLHLLALYDHFLVNMPQLALHTFKLSLR